MRVAHFCLAIWLIWLGMPTPAMAESKGADEKPRLSQLCGGSVEFQQIQISILRPGIVFRVYPSPERIIEIGEQRKINRNSPIWNRVKTQICDESTIRPSANKHEFLPAVILSAHGVPISEAIRLDYPDYQDGAQAVRIRNGQAFGEIDRWVVRYLLDYSSPVAPLSDSDASASLR